MRLFRRIGGPAIATIVLAMAGPTVQGAVLTKHPNDIGGPAGKPDLGLAARRPHDRRVRFEQNVGQAPREVKYLSRLADVSLYLTDSEMVVVPASTAPKEGVAQAASAVRIRLSSGRTARLTGETRLSSYSNYFIGNDAGRWMKQVPHYERVEWHDVLPGVDVQFHGANGALEFDLELAPGARRDRLEMELTGHRALSVGKNGELMVEMPAGRLTLARPIAFQEHGGRRQEVDVRYEVRGKGRVRLVAARHDSARALVIDPVLTFSSYLGGGISSNVGAGRDVGNDIATDSFGNIYLVGTTVCTDFPTQAPNPFPPLSANPQARAFVTKFAANGQLLYSSYFGGTTAINGTANGAVERGNSVALDPIGDVWIVGHTYSSDFPGAGAVPSGLVSAGFAAKIRSDGSALLFSTYVAAAIPALEEEEAVAVAVDPQGNAYVLASAYIPNGPITRRAHVVCFSSIGAAQYDSIAIPGRVAPWGIDVDRTGHAYVVGQAHPAMSALLVRLTLSGAVDWSQELGPGGSSALDVAVDADSNAYMVGSTGAPDFPVFPGVYGSAAGGSAFIAKYDVAGNRLFSVPFGGSGSDGASGISLSEAGAVVVGGTFSTNYPLASPLPNGDSLRGSTDTFVTVIPFDLGLLPFSTYLGGTSGESAGDVATDSGKIVLAGKTESIDFPLAQPYQNELKGDSDAFISEIVSCDLPTVTPPSGQVPLLGNGWSMTVEVSEDDGVVLRDVTFGFRYMAKQMSLPYLILSTGAASGRFELMPNSSFGGARSRLVNFEIKNDPGTLRMGIFATYVIDQFSSGGSCLLVRQAYEFGQAQENDCEPSEETDPLGYLGVVPLPCVRFFPTVRYRYLDAPGEELNSISIPLRMHFRADGKTTNTVALFRDCNLPVPILPWEPCPLIGGLICARANPLPVEGIVTGVVAGDAGAWDNVHQTWRSRTDEPNPNNSCHASEFEFWPKGGCPECVHMHWRWGVDLAHFGSQRPLVLGSDQDLDLAFSRYHPGEEDPVTFSDLLGSESLIGGEVVTWYQGTSQRESDIFGSHGGYYGDVSSPDVDGWFGGGGPSDEAGVGVKFATITEPGITPFTLIEPASAVGLLPGGYGIFDENAVDIDTTATVSGDILVRVRLGYVDDPALFSRLRILHRESGNLVDRTILAPDSPPSDFASRTLYARVSSLGPFVVGVLASGSDLIFQDGFESGTFGAWSEVAGEPLVTVSPVAALRSTSKGMLIDVAGAHKERGVRRTFATGEGRVRVRFYFDPNGTGPDPGSSEINAPITTRLLRLRADSSLAGAVELVIDPLTSVRHVRASALGTLGDLIPIDDAPHWIEIDWKTASSATSGDGWMDIWIDNQFGGRLPALPNENLLIETVDLGSFNATPGAVGSIYIDEFVARRESFTGQ
jgi:hypothetical protein